MNRDILLTVEGLEIEFKDLILLYDMDRFHDENIVSCIYKMLNTKLKKVLLSHKINNIGYDYLILGNIKVTNKGLRIDLERLIEELIKYYGIKKEENLVKQLVELRESINIKNIKEISKRSKSFDNTYWYYTRKTLKEKILKKGNITKIVHISEREDQEKIVSRIKHNINLFINMIYNIEEYQKIEGLYIDMDNINLYLAYKLKDKVKELEEKDNDLYNYYLNILNEYVEANIELLDNEYEFYGYDKTYRFEDIYKYVNNKEENSLVKIKK